MERAKTIQAVTALVAPQSAESSGARALSVRRLSPALKLQVGSMLDQMTAAFPSQELHPDTARMYQRGAETLAEEYGIARVETALESFITRQKFFPHPSEIREVLEVMAAKERTEKQAANPYIPDPNCNHNAPGWKRTKDVDGDDVMSRCDCWKAWKGVRQPAADRKTVAAGA